MIRKAAYHIVYEVLENGKKSDELYHHYIQTEDIKASHRHAIKRLSYGTIERMVTLDAILDKVSSRPVTKLDKEVRTILRLGAYEMIYADDIPYYATCKEMVELAGKICDEKYKKSTSGRENGYINAVLRSLSRLCESNEDLIFKGLTPAQTLGFTKDFYDLLADKYGKKTVKKIGEAFLDKDKGISLHINKNLTTLVEYMDILSKTSGISVKKGRYFDDVCIVSGADDIKNLYGYDKGYFYVQDENSMLPVEISGITSGDTVVDVCAAPGGKSVHALMKLNGSGFLSARDKTPAKVDILSDNLMRMGFSKDNYECICADAMSGDTSWKKRADVVICDVPCSGIGVIGKKPEIRHRAVASVSELIPVQRQIVRMAVDFLRPGGTLIYSTCTVGTDENEGNVLYFEEELGLKRQSIDKYLPEGLKNSMTDKGWIQLIPGLTDTDGFFAARLVKPV